MHPTKLFLAEIKSNHHFNKTILFDNYICFSEHKMHRFIPVNDSTLNWS